MSAYVPAGELADRMQRLRNHLDTTAREWELAAVMTKINLYYLTGTMQAGVLLIPRDAEAVYCVRRSFTRAARESAFSNIVPMKSFRDAVTHVSALPKTVHLETEGVPLAHFDRFQKYFQCKYAALDPHLAAVRAVKSPLELELMEQAGSIHALALDELLPGMLREGISEAELGSELLHVMISHGHHGVERAGIYDTELFLGSVCFSENALDPNPFEGPDGVRGLGAYAPFFGSRDRKLKRGDLVFVDVGCGYEGYHTDKSVVYAFGDVATEPRRLHRKCLDILEQVAAELKPGTIPSELYTRVTEGLGDEFRKNFMGYGDQQVSFLGHGIGLTIAEFPVIAERFDDPIQENMVFAVEPKKGMTDIGLVGAEETFIVTPEGGRCITGAQSPELKVI